MHRVLAAIVGLLLVGNAVAVATVNDDEHPALRSAASATSTTSVPASTTSVSPAATSTTAPDPVAAVVKELQAFVEARRKLKFTQPLKFTLLSNAAFRARLLQLAKEDDAELAKTGRELVALGLLKRGVDLRKARDELLGAAVIGVYDPKAAELFVRGTKITPFVRTTLVHEITHALQDQNFKIEHPEYAKRDDEIDLTFSAVAEGDAVRIEEAYRNTLSTAERRQASAEEFALAGSINPAVIPPVLSQLLVFPYTDGKSLVEALLKAGGSERVDAAFREPPTTTEQVIHPERFLAGERPKTVATPRADGDVIDQGVVGEYLLKLMLSSVSPGDAARAADGWGGDRYVAWDRGDVTCLRVAITMDTTKDRDELRDVLGRWAAKQREAAVTGADPLVVTACD
ncbi:MAG: hypothetical protein H0W70_09760 [Actinobacteria bacterium]|nr:hypothetical protein [Actinomycetota bacterium]